MPAQLDINSTLQGFRAAVDEKIRAGYFKKYGAPHLVMERHSYIYSDIRAGLLSKAKVNSGDPGRAKKFTLKDLEEVAKNDGENVASAINRAYVSEAKKRGM